MHQQQQNSQYAPHSASQYPSDTHQNQQHQVAYPVQHAVPVPQEIASSLSAPGDRNLELVAVPALLSEGQLGQGSSSCENQKVSHHSHEKRSLAATAASLATTATTPVGTHSQGVLLAGPPGLSLPGAPMVVPHPAATQEEDDEEEDDRFCVKKKVSSGGGHEKAGHGEGHEYEKTEPQAVIAAEAGVSEDPLLATEQSVGVASVGEKVKSRKSRSTPLQAITVATATSFGREMGHFSGGLGYGGYGGHMGHSGMKGMNENFQSSSDEEETESQRERRENDLELQEKRLLEKKKEIDALVKEKEKENAELHAKEREAKMKEYAEKKRLKMKEGGGGYCVNPNTGYVNSHTGSRFAHPLTAGPQNLGPQNSNLVGGQPGGPQNSQATHPAQHPDAQPPRGGALAGIGSYHQHHYGNNRSSLGTAAGHGNAGNAGNPAGNIRGNHHQNQNQHPNQGGSAHHSGGSAHQTEPSWDALGYFEEDEFANKVSSYITEATKEVGTGAEHKAEHKKNMNQGSSSSSASEVQVGSSASEVQVEQVVHPNVHPNASENRVVSDVQNDVQNDVHRDVHPNDEDDHG